MMIVKLTMTKKCEIHVLTSTFVSLQDSVNVVYKTQSSIDENCHILLGGIFHKSINLSVDSQNT